MTSERVMAESAIRIDGVRKKYRLFPSATHRLKEAFHPFRKRYHRDFWALDGITFDVPRGQTVGILGRNGSGKSTLLQVIAGVFVPNEGRVEVNGRVAALLELGAGFNPEFSGRENALLAGRMMGAARFEIHSRMQEIEAFADIGQFFDQPVKTYSSGMFVRVAFAAAINVDPDILIIDEALAVGDARFQHKCFQVFQRFLDAGKTLLVVSHDTGMLLRLCKLGIVLEQGKIYFQGSIVDAVNRYQALLFGGGNASAARKDNGADSLPPPVAPQPVQSGKDLPAAKRSWPIDLAGSEDVCHRRPSYNPGETRLGIGRVRILDYAIVADDMLDPPVIPHRARMDIYFKIHFLEDVDHLSVGFALTNKEGVYVHGMNINLQRQPLLSGRQGESILIRISWHSVLVGGDYFLNIGTDRITDEQNTYLDIRRALAHIRCADTTWCNGFVAMESTVEVLERAYPSSDGRAETGPDLEVGQEAGQSR